MGWTWYLANDFQFYAFAPLLIVLLHRWRKAGLLLALCCLLGSALFTLLITLQKGYPPAPILTSKLQMWVSMTWHCPWRATLCIVWSPEVIYSNCSHPNCSNS